MTLPAPTDRMLPLDRLAGVWRTSITMLDSQGKSAGSGSATNTFSWMMGGHHLCHEVNGLMDGQDLGRLELFGAPDDMAEETFFSRAYNSDGSIEDFDITLDGDAISIDGDESRYRGRFVSPGRQEGTWEARDGRTWRPIMRVQLDRDETLSVD